MRKLLALGMFLTAFLVAAAPAEAAAVGLRVSGRNVVEANGSTFIMRGTSHPHVWYTSQTRSFADIKALGANTVRVVLSGGRWPANSVDDVANVVSLCKTNKLVCVLENHDTTGYGEQGGAVTLDAAANYWISVQSALTGQENTVVVNIGNEPVGNNPVTPGWADATSAAIVKLRNAGFQHLLMVDAPAWGQDWQNVMRTDAPTVFNADPQRNTVFSVHMYGVYDTAAEINAYFDAFQTAGLPLVVGEFGHNHSDGNPDEDTIMAQAQARGIGYLGWSWSGNSGGVEYLDQVVNFNPAQLTDWGRRLFQGANGIAATSRECTMCGGGASDTTPPTAPANLAASGTTSSSTSLAWTASTDNVGVTGYIVQRAGATGDFAQAGTSTTTSFAATGLSPSTTYRFRVLARDAAGNLSPVSNTVSVVTQSGGGTCTATATLQNRWPSGYVIQPVTVTNGSAARTSWTVTFTLPAGHTIAGYWNAALTVSGQTVTARNMPYNGSLGPNAGTTFGFQVSGGSGEPSGYNCA